MTIPKRGSRGISVRGERFRWMARPTDDFRVRLTVERESDPGRTVVTYTPECSSAEALPALTPKFVQLFLEHVLEQGWPVARGQSYFRFCTSEETYAARRTLGDPKLKPTALKTHLDFMASSSRYPWEHYRHVFVTTAVDGLVKDKVVGSIFADLAFHGEIKAGGTSRSVLAKVAERMLSTSAFYELDNEEAEQFFPIHIYGGRVLLAEDTVLMPHGCCATIDEWEDWRAPVAKDLYNGHDPFSSAEVVGDQVHFHLDGTRKSEIRTTRSAYNELFSAMETDLAAFYRRVCEWLDAHAAPNTAKKIADVFSGYLHLPSR